MQKVMPKRKFNANGKRGKNSKDTSVNDPDEDGEDDEPIDDGNVVKSDDVDAPAVVDAALNLNGSL
jgi:hypothetical protein